MNKTFLVLMVLINSITVSFGQIIIEGFEEWKDTLSAEYPANWDVYPEIDTTLLNVQKVEKLNEGQSAVKLKSNVAFFEGNLPTIIGMELPIYSDLISIKFTYKCEGEGSCDLFLGQGNIGSTGSNPRVIWTAEAGESTLYQVELDSVLINSPFDVFKSISLAARPVDTGLGTYGISVFTVDSMIITDENLSVSAESYADNLEIEVFPNPTNSIVRIVKKNEDDYNILRIEIRDASGVLINVFQGDKDMIPINGPSGVYNLLLVTEKGIIYKKIIKKNL